MGEFLVEVTTARRGLPLTGDEDGAPAGEEIETGPLISKHQWVAQRRAGKACRSDAHAIGAGGDRSQRGKTGVLFPWPARRMPIAGSKPSPNAVACPRV